MGKAGATVDPQTAQSQPGSGHQQIPCKSTDSRDPRTKLALPPLCRHAANAAMPPGFAARGKDAASFAAMPPRFAAKLCRHAASFAARGKDAATLPPYCRHYAATCRQTEPPEARMPLALPPALPPA